jgi:hypothetical protein
MNYTFKKSRLNNFDDNYWGQIKDCSVYAVTSSDQIIGQVIITQKEAYLSLPTSKCQVDFKTTLLKPTIGKIKDVNLNEEVGIITFDNPMFSMSQQIGTLKIYNNVYIAYEQKSDIRYNPLDKKTWGKYKVALTDTRSTVEYNLHLDTSIFDVANSQLRDGTGEIKTTEEDLQITLFGILFLEYLLETDDTYQ